MHTKKNRKSRRSLISFFGLPIRRCASLLLVLIGFLNASAQSGVYQFQNTSGVEAMTSILQKSIQEVVRDVDPRGVVSFHEDLVKMKVENTSATEMKYMLDQLEGGEFILLSAPEETQLDLPWRVLNADGTENVEATELAKQQWVEQHPELYQQLLEGMHVLEED